MVSRKITRPIEEMKIAAKRFATGQLDHRVPVPDSEELAELAGALNETADPSPSGQSKQSLIRRHQLETILGSMTEVVIAVDSDGKIMSINKKAAQLLEIEGVSTAGIVSKRQSETPTFSDL